MSEELQNELSYLENAGQAFFEQHQLERTQTSETQIEYDGADWGLDFSYDYRYQRMIFGGMYLRVKASNGRYPMKDLLEFLHPENHSFDQMRKTHEDLTLPSLKMHLHLIGLHLGTLLEQKDFSWQEPFSAALRKKYPWFK